MPAKIDCRKELKTLYAPSAKEVSQVVVPEFRFFMIDGRGDPNTSPEFAQAVEALFSVAYTAKFLLKKGPQAIDYGVMPLEGLWWAEDMAAFRSQDKALWQWTLMVLQPDIVPEEVLDRAVADVRRKKALPVLDKVRLERFAEGPSAQILHVGPFSEEGPAIERLHAFIEARGALSGKHHEIYLSDMRHTESAKWKTILRQPMRLGAATRP